jgi:hypothetical protein
MSAGNPAAMSGRCNSVSASGPLGPTNDSSFVAAIPNLWEESVKEAFLRTPARPPLDGLKKRLERSRAARGGRSRDGFLRETFVLSRTEARLKAQEWFERWPKQAYWTEIESWFERPGDVIEFTIRRLPAAD